LVALCLLFAFATAFSEKEYDDAFTQWMIQYQKSYDGEEFFYRFGVFKSNMDFVADWNSRNQTSTVGLNKFADLTSGEFKLIYTGLKPALRRSAPDYSNQPAPITYPGTLNWTAKGVVTPVKDQGQCGSCWAFSTTGSMESIIAINHGLDALVSLSEQELVDCAGAYGNYGCNGGLMDSAFQYCMAYGDTTEVAYPYVAYNQPSCLPASQSPSSFTKLSNYKDVAQTADALGAAVDMQPISIAIEADQAAFQMYTGGVITSGCGTSLDHGVLAVGYGTDAATGEDYWLVKNSWGTGWGEQGYVRISRSTASSPWGVCGILQMNSYPFA